MATSNTDDNIEESNVTPDQAKTVPASILQDGRALVRIIDVSFNGTPTIVYPVDLPPHKDGIARIFMFIIGAYLSHYYWENQLANLFHEDFHELVRDTYLNQPHSTDFGQNDIRSIAQQWDVNKKTLDPQIWLKTMLRLGGDAKRSSLEIHHSANKFVAIIFIQEESGQIYSSDHGELLFQRFIRTDLNGFASMADGSREQLAKLIVLDFLASSVYLMPVREIRRYSWPEAEFILGSERSRTPTVEGYVELLSQCETTLQELEDLAEAIDFVVESFQKYSPPKDRAVTSQQGEGDNRDFVTERMFILQKLCYQRRGNVERAIVRLNRQFEGQNKLLNIKESESVKRLSILATIFLPLSLSASILSIQSRFRDLDLKLYDFLGVFVVLGSAALVMLLLVRAMSKIKASKFGNWLSPKELWLEKPSLWPFNKGKMSKWRLLSVSLSLWYALAWAVVLVSFVVGMVEDVILGVKILGFGFVGLLGYALIWIGISIRIEVKELRTQKMSGIIWRKPKREEERNSLNTDNESL